MSSEIAEALFRHPANGSPQIMSVVSFAKQALCPVHSDKVSGSHLKSPAENVIVGTTEVHFFYKLKSELILIKQKGNMN